MITAVLLKWKRESELDAIIADLKRYPDLIDEIIVHDNREQNSICYARYLEASKAKNNTIYIQDDDCIVHNIRWLAEEYKKNNEKYYVNALRDSHKNKEDSTIPPWGAIFDKRWISVLDKYIKRYGIDFLLLREADRIFAGLLKKKHSITAFATDFPSASGEMALWKQEIHKKMKKEALKRVKKLNSPISFFYYSWIGRKLFPDMEIDRGNE